MMGLEMTELEPTRYARVDLHRTSEEEIARYLPANYEIVGSHGEDAVLIHGNDNAGWTLDGYVIPRLGSGMIHAEEIFPPACFQPMHGTPMERANDNVKVH